MRAIFKFAVGFALGTAFALAVGAVFFFLGFEYLANLCARTSFLVGIGAGAWNWRAEKKRIRSGLSALQQKELEAYHEAEKWRNGDRT